MSIVGRGDHGMPAGLEHVSKLRVGDRFVDSFVLPPATAIAAQADPRFEWIQYARATTPRFSMSHAPDGWTVVPETHEAVRLLQGGARERTLQLLDAVVGIGDGRTRPLRLRSMSLMDDRQQYQAHRTFGTLADGVRRTEDVELETERVRTVLDDLWNGRAIDHSAGEWTGWNDSLAVTPVGFQQRSALVEFLRTGKVAENRSALLEQLVFLRHEVEHAASDIPRHVPTIDKGDWIEEATAQLITSQRAPFLAFVRDAVGLDITAKQLEDLPRVVQRLDQTYDMEQLHLRHLLGYAGIASGPIDARSGQRLIRLLQGGPYLERADRVADAIARAHPDVPRDSIRALVDPPFMAKSAFQTGPKAPRDWSAHGFEGLDELLRTSPGPRPRIGDPRRANALTGPNAWMESLRRGA